MTSEFVRNIHLATAQRMKEQGVDLYGIVEHFENVFMPMDEVPDLLGQLGYPQQDLKQFLKGKRTFGESHKLLEYIRENFTLAEFTLLKSTACEKFGGSVILMSSLLNHAIFTYIYARIAAIGQNFGNIGFSSKFKAHIMASLLT